jgi:iron complex outermembrane receptor protein
MPTNLHRQRSRACVRALRSVVFATWMASLVTGSAWANSDLGDMSLEDLMSMEVTSVSKKAQNKTDTAASITVITSEDLRRGGFNSVPEALRIVPGIQVAQIDANRWAISARGFNQEFANKLLVLIDGRSVYTPLFGGVYWDIQDYPIEDIERIEVVRGPGGTVWGVNAVNGVINVITKHSSDTEGVLMSGFGGSQEHGATGRYGLRLNDDTTFRVYGRGAMVDDYDVTSRHDAKDRWNRVQTGFRIDSAPTEQDSVRLSADYYHVNFDRGQLNLTNPFNPVHQRRNNEAQGGNVLINWDHKLENAGTVSTKAFYDRTYRDTGADEDRHTADLEIQHDVSFNEGESVETHLTWGVNYRFSTSHISGTTNLSLVPDNKEFHLGNGFVQGQVDLFDKSLALIAGIKLGGNNWSGFDYQPSGRILWKAAEGHTLWGAVSRAVRTPTQLDRDLFAVLPTSTPPFFAAVLAGNNDQRSEELLSFEVGYRFFPFERITAEVSVFHHMYENVTSLAASPVSAVPPLPTFAFRNDGEVETTGAEFEVNLKPWEWWRVSLGWSILEVESDLPFSPLSGVSVNETYPQYQVSLRTFFDLPGGFEFDASAYWVDGLSGVVPTRFPATTKGVDQYVRLDLRIGYKPTDWLELALVGQNLLQSRHAEFTDVQSNLSSEVPRSGYGKVTLRF